MFLDTNISTISQSNKFGLVYKMSRYSGFNGRKKLPYAYGGTRVGMNSLKTVASASANPGSVPIQPGPSESPSNSLAASTNIGDVYGQTPRNQPPKYKYKYKYPLGRKRKRVAGEGGGPTDKKLRWEYGSDSDNDGKPGIEPRSVPGDQYAQGASVNTEADKKRKAEEDNTPLDEYTVNSEYINAGNEMAEEDYANILAQASGILTSADFILSIIPGAEAIPFRTAITKLKNTVNDMTTTAQTVAKLSPVLHTLESKVKGWGKSTLEKLAEEGPEAWKNFMDNLQSLTVHVDQNAKANPPGRGFVPPKGVGNQPGESYVPEANVTSVDAGVSFGERDTSNQGEEPMQAYGGTEQKAMGGDPNRLNPITPATGSRQTAATANSLISIKKLKAAAERTTRELGPAAVHGNARERANMGKGALDTYEFQGPYDYPVYPGGRPDDSLTMMGAWRTNGGNDSSLWYSKKTAKGANAKRNKYFKWSMKGGGRWRKMSKDEMVNVIQKGGQSDNRFYGTRTNLKFAEFQRNRDRNVAMGRAGNAKVVESEHGDFSRGRNKYVDANKVGVATQQDVPPPGKPGERKQEPTEGTSGEGVGSKKEDDDIYGGHALEMFSSDLDKSSYARFYIPSRELDEGHYKEFVKGKRAGKWGSTEEYLNDLRRRKSA